MPSCDKTRHSIQSGSDCLFGYDEPDTQIKGSLCVSDQAVQWTNTAASAYKKPCTDRIANRFQNISTQGLCEYFLGPTFALIKRVGNFENKFLPETQESAFPVDSRRSP